MNFKWLRLSKVVDEIPAIILWEVRWFSLDSKDGTRYSKEFEPELEGFKTKELAEQFANSLRDAIRLLKFTGQKFKVTVKEAKING